MQLGLRYLYGNGDTGLSIKLFDASVMLRVFRERAKRGYYDPAVARKVFFG